MSTHLAEETFQCSLKATLGGPACQMLAEASGLPKSRIKIAMAKGAVWLKREGAKERRIRKAKFELKMGDRVQLFYNPQVLAQAPPIPVCLEEEEEYSVWFKPAWLLSQGTRYGDHCSLLRLTEKSMQHKDIKLIHRLDREATGVMLLAHSSKGARLLSQLFQENRIKKAYFAEVWGNPVLPESGLELTEPLDGKDACTEIVAAYPGGTEESTLLDIRLHSGRLHQIRRHLSDWGHPILGDAKYGSRERPKKHTTLHLCAWQISFESPFDGRKRCYQPPTELCPDFARSRLKRSQRDT